MYTYIYQYLYFALQSYAGPKSWTAFLGALLASSLASWTPSCLSCLVPGPPYCFPSSPGPLLDVPMPQDVLLEPFQVSSNSAPKCAITRTGRCAPVLPGLMDGFLAVLPDPWASVLHSFIARTTFGLPNATARAPGAVPGVAQKYTNLCYNACWTLRSIGLPAWPAGPAWAPVLPAWASVLPFLSRSPAFPGLQDCSRVLRRRPGGAPGTLRECLRAPS